MTIIIAYQSWKAVAVIADCRISYEPPYEKVDDCLQKLYQIHNRLVLGFAGPLEGAYQVIQLVRENARRYSHRPIADNLQADVERWIRYEYRHLEASHRKGLSFLLATIEPRREKRSKWIRDGKETTKPKWFPFVPEWNTLALRPCDKDPSELVSEKMRFAKVLGLVKDDRVAVEQVIQKFYGFSFKQPELQIQAVMGALNFELMKRGIRAVGGLYQSALLSERGIQWLGYAGENVVLRLVQGRFAQQNTATGETLPLMAIWEWAKLRPRPGTFGPFEDPGLKEAIENLRRAESNANDSADC